jgi:hypothetical protein
VQGSVGKHAGDGLPIAPALLVSEQSLLLTCMCGGQHVTQGGLCCSWK